MKAKGNKSDHQAYLDKIGTLSFKNTRWNQRTIAEMRDFLSPWSHNIKLPYRIFTAWEALDNAKAR